ncbi:hypothetical protein GCM10010294_70020 [Streptomyces griseoloalbus]|nr:hypothetical protein GCM10010294_70020 [Streptomyces griseoloalbus]
MVTLWGRCIQPGGDPHCSEITETNLTAVWANSARRGYRRLIYTATLSVLPEETGMFQRAMGTGVRIVWVLLTASDATARERLMRRELGSELEQELEGSARKARLLDQRLPHGRAGLGGRCGDRDFPGRQRR